MKFAISPFQQGNANPMAVIVGPQPGANFPVANVATAVSGQSAAETIVNQLATGKVFGASVSGTAAAGNKAIAELNNPNASGVAVYVYAIDLFTPVAMQITLVLGGTTLGAGAAAVNMNVGGATSAARVVAGNQLAPTGNTVWTSPSLTANTMLQIPIPWIARLPANTVLQVIGQTVNQAFTANFRWFENLG